MWFDLFCKDKILQRQSCLLGILQLQKLVSSKTLTLRLIFFKCKFSTFITLNPSCRIRHFNINVKKKERLRFCFGLTKKHREKTPKKVSSK